MWILAFLTSALAADCTTGPTTALDVIDMMEQAQLAYTTKKWANFSTAIDGLNPRIACLTEPLAPADAAGVHRAFGLAALRDGQELKAMYAFKAAMRLAPDWAPPAQLGKADASLNALLDAAKSQAEPTPREVTAPDDHALLVDGTAAGAVPDRIPSVVQLADAGGKVVWGVWIPNASPLPDLLKTAIPSPEASGEATPATATVNVTDGDASASPVVGPATAAVAAAAERAPADEWSAARTSGAASDDSRRGLLTGATVSGITAAALYGTAIGLRVAYENNPTPGGRNATNGMMVGSSTATAVAIGLGTAGLLTKGARK